MHQYAENMADGNWRIKKNVLFCTETSKKGSIYQYIAVRPAASTPPEQWAPPVHVTLSTVHLLSHPEYNHISAIGK